MSVPYEDVVRWVKTFAAVIADQKAYLTELDSAIGDADHGANMRRGMKAVVAKLDAAPDAPPSTLLKTAGMTLVSTVGGASGPLWRRARAHSCCWGRRRSASRRVTVSAWSAATVPARRR